jgi:cytochrome c biogenesis protein CcmG, thiol:disulfide interchange protein DsbE
VRRVLIPLLALGLGLAACSGGGEVADFGSAAPGDAQPELPADRGLDLAEVEEPDTVPPADAELVEAGWPEAAAWIRRENAAGNPVVVNFFASWCGPCERELPLLIETARGQGDISFLGVNHTDQRPLAQAMLDEYGVDFPTLYDAPGDIAFEVGARGLPTTVGFDTDGRLVSRVFGELNDANLGKLLDELR